MIKYVSKDVAALFSIAEPQKKLIELLWGDQFHIESGPQNGFYTGYARGIHGSVREDDLGDTSLLEFYFIDVGQGDGVLIRTPDDKHILVDGGYARKSQPSGKNAADFVDWKFAKDYRRTETKIDVMISSHCDADHYGGLWDLINPAETEELSPNKVIVRQFYHSGISWWKKNGGARNTGDVKNNLITTLLENNDSINATLKPGSVWTLQGEWGEFIRLVNSLNIPAERLCFKPGTAIPKLPGFDDIDIRILGPVEHTADGVIGYTDLESDSQNTNGHSVTLRFDYGNFRLLLTGDLNAASQKLLLESHSGNKLNFQADVTKACHHGSDDCSYEFLQHINAAATVISSGDSENHDHPRPAIVAASALTGYKVIKDDKVITPLIYSTEISRSYKLGKPYQVNVAENDTTQTYREMKNIKVLYEESKSGDLNPQKKSRDMDKLYVVGGITYGLVNVRTDGKKILCATLNENKHEWEIRKFNSRF